MVSRTRLHVPQNWWLTALIKTDSSLKAFNPDVRRRAIAHPVVAYGQRAEPIGKHLFQLAGVDWRKHSAQTHRHQLDESDIHRLVFCEKRNWIYLSVRISTYRHAVDFHVQASFQSPVDRGQHVIHPGASGDLFKTAEDPLYPG